ncbi:lysophospholipid acyltransferase family protein [Candidatus Protochlamydia amoebophila]|uniref:lysophospholipid acyltransferase family protein n=1 Tax=Candidatus Protochlamydia amoebophila TaxID=362787 RepID=UPI001BC9F060|nr:lysophospholipid acyltransferase family protein [Candidatus Protochlamydia amoebophila]
MLKKLKQGWKNFSYRCFAFLIATIGKALIRILLATCRWKVHGLEKYIKIAEKEKCIVMFWHNRLALAPFILYHLTPQFIYAAFISNSRDGELIGRIVRSYKTGRVIRVPHHSRHEALREMIRHVNFKKSIAIITPDGPRGPRYKMKPGIALAAIETGAYVFPLNWTATSFFTFKTWDQLRLPKPFSTIEFFFGEPIKFSSDVPLNIAQTHLQKSLKE